MNISDLNKSISEMTEEELHKLIHLNRTERRKSDKPIRKKKAKAKAKPKAAKPIKNLRTMASTMSKAERAALLESLEGA